METRQIDKQAVKVHTYNTVIVGAGAAGMNCAVHLYEFMKQKGVADAQTRIAVITRGLPLGASRMSGSDKQTYYKMGTSPDVSDSAESFAKTLTAAGCTHGDLALAEAVGSLREFYHLVQLGVPFPHDAMGSFAGYKTDHDPYERATSAGPKTSKMMSEFLQAQVETYGVAIFDQQEVVQLLTFAGGQKRSIVGVVTMDRKAQEGANYALNLFLAENIVLAAGGPGGLYETTVYPKGQLGIHGVAFEAGLAGENLTESQFGLASIKFRWNVSGTYMQVIPRIYSTDADGNDEREFLATYFPTMGKMASNIFLKGYQWPFDPQRIENLQSSLIDILVFNETQKGRHVFMGFRSNAVPAGSMRQFDLNELEEEALSYLEQTGALQATPIQRLAHMNPLAIEIYSEHGIDLYSEPLEIAVCAQHNNGGFAVNKWWESNIPHTFVIGEMAGTHGVKRPGGSALNAGQTGGLRAAEYIANVYGCKTADYQSRSEFLDEQLKACVDRLDKIAASTGQYTPVEVHKQIRLRMTASAGHIRQIDDAKQALVEAITLYDDIKNKGFKLTGPRDILPAVQAQHLALTSIAYLKAIVTLLEQGSGSRGSHLVLSEDGLEIHPDITDKAGGKALKLKPENEQLRNSVLRLEYNADSPELFRAQNVVLRSAPSGRKAFESLWRDFRQASIFKIGAG